MTAVDEIKARLDIVDIVSEHVSLKKAGRNFRGLCPFHAEKTPSFFVFPETGTWHCFGACGIGGDLFAFVMKHDNLDFGEALRLLAQKAGVQLEQSGKRDAEEQKQFQKLYDIQAAAAAFYHQTLIRSPAGEAARAYAAMRGLNDETVQRFQLGMAIDAWHALSNALLARGYQREDLVEAGLVVIRDDGGYHDRFRGRLMIPIRDSQGHVVGFGGRILDKSEPKYLNSPQTPLFNKSHVLFGLDLAKGAIRAQGYVVIVEGYMDVLQAHQAGFSNVVASMGTALTEPQLDALKRLTKRYVLALDPDMAGDQGTLRGLAVARQTLDRETVPVPTANGWIRYESRLDADIRIMTLPEGQDPDDVIRKTPELWEPLVEAAVPIADYYFGVATQDLDMTSAKGKSEAVHRLAPMLSEIRDEVERTHYVQKLARMIRVDEATVRRQLGLEARHGNKKQTQTPAKRPVEQFASPALSRGEYCLATLLRRPEFLERVDALLASLALSPLQADDFEQAETRALFAAWLKSQEGQDWNQWMDSLPSALRAHLDLLLKQGPDTDELFGKDAERDVERQALQLRRRNLERQIQGLQLLQSDAFEQASADLSEYNRIMAKLAAEKARLDRASGERTSSGKREERERVL